eukprot:CAMPEP_0117807100 /NCGR_PEP_ID=MMETSP0948-20121206/19048_1 /TAXON_ID=44440 /ORGANISM="Chattonella subsalsa, Strain CCMP2191" /LENGTH=152 /DNA_ID=CAMNT_0005641873 /DNA_START=3 /DNA_END=458 /DNA_ORIENTATION=+
MTRFCFAGLGGVLCVELQKDGGARLKNIENIGVDVVAVRSVLTEYSGTLLLLGCSDGRVHIWSWDKEICVGCEQRLQHDDEGNQLIVLEVVGEQVYLGLTSGTVELWELPRLVAANGSAPQSTLKVEGAVTSIQASRKGSYVILGTTTCCVW